LIIKQGAMNMEITETAVTDLGLASCLLTLGYEIIKTKKDIRGRVFFIFASSEDLEGDINSYWSDSLKIYPRLYFDSIKLLKNRIYNGA
jgi:hypothetical protein